MTITIMIENTDKERDVEVIEVFIDKATGQRTQGTPHRVGPGMKASATIYMLRDVLVREVDPIPH